jgi:hypothetical protein
MRTSVKAWLLNILIVSVGSIALLFSMVATWVIIHRTVEILHTMPVSMNAIIGGTLFAGLILLWLNSLLLDSIMWMTSRYWAHINSKGGKRE